MKLKTLIEYLEQFDEEKDIIFYEISDLYDIMFVGIDEGPDNVYLNIKNLQRDKKKEFIH